MFKGGLADSSEQTAKLHTAAHLMLAALRRVLGDQVVQRGSNITASRLRFDFSYPNKLTSQQIQQVQDLVNEQNPKNNPVVRQEMSLEEARAQGAMGVILTPNMASGLAFILLVIFPKKFAAVRMLIILLNLATLKLLKKKAPPREYAALKRS